MEPRVARAVGLLLGALLDAVVPDPQRFHPVAGYGRAAGALERAVWADSRARGTAYALVAVGVPALAGAVVERRVRRSPAAQVALTAAVTWSVLGGTSLRRVGRGIGRSLGDGNVAAARDRLPWLCGRDPAQLDATELSRATVESVAENTSDAAVAPLVWGAALGVPGLVAYRAANTLDAMVGSRSPRYARFGWASARLDDVLNLVPARLTGALASAAAPVVGGSARTAWSVLLRDGGAHPSPNAGRCEAAFAGALGVRLGGRNVYAGRVEHRPLLGAEGRPCAGADAEGAARLSAVTERLALLVCCAAVVARP
ncbi:adenosylcobinamide-phosphate synthase [Motilibacter rhizosphaerae]|uniref:Cobalamin biosynthesis protein CobD n=1 Tax=Motilibacter rhizosphaerae TaxID=598652 RepID=A0A4Q7NTY3_9ACTN|nr:cobalamin biosynthesis protein [Motilibacter rhizosphaerae]RZS89872.1 adenosylcobinamide-phosphate synthase [Motilibacter rhizosphaerae]